MVEADDVVEARIALISNLPADVSCNYLQLSVEPAAKKEPHNNKKILKDDDIKPDKLVSW